MTKHPAFKKYSAERDPLFPVLKFSTDLTVFFSKGTLVPPDVISTIGRLTYFDFSKKSLT
jgi:hypothetical protein